MGRSQHTRQHFETLLQLLAGDQRHMTVSDEQKKLLSEPEQLLAVIPTAAKHEVQIHPMSGSLCLQARDAIAIPISMRSGRFEPQEQHILPSRLRRTDDARPAHAEIVARFSLFVRLKTSRFYLTPHTFAIQISRTKRKPIPAFSRRNIHRRLLIAS